MKTIIKPVLVISALLIGSLTSFAQGGAGIVGTWEMTLDTPQGTRTFPFVIKEEGGKLAPSKPFTSAELKDKDIKMLMTVQVQGNDLVITYTGKIDGDTMKGDADFGGFASGAWTAKRKAADTAAPAEASAGAVNITGTWNAAVETSQGSGTPTFVFKQDGETLTGTYTGQLGSAPLKGTVKGNDIMFAVKVNYSGQDLELKFSGKIAGDTMKGKATYDQLGEATWSAKKK